VKSVACALAATVFAFALLASGQSYAFTRTIDEQILMEDFLNLKIPHAG